MQTVADADELLGAALALGAPARRGVLVDIRRSLPLQTEVRHRYRGRHLSGFCALAMLIEASALGRMMGNVYLRVARLQLPTQLFDDEALALQWLRAEVARG